MRSSCLAPQNLKSEFKRAYPPARNSFDKFGEGGLVTRPHLSETAIVYAPNGNYLITIMTEGKDVQQLAPIIAELSKAAYDGMNQASASAQRVAN
jgi:hypothetical protein